MSGGTISGNGEGLAADADGGGVHMTGNNGIFAMTGGTIRENTARNGGALHSTNLANVTIAPAAVFQANVATEGLRLDNALAAQFPGINPGTVTHGEHAFNNHDIATPAQ